MEASTKDKMPTSGKGNNSAKHLATISSPGLLSEGSATRTPGPAVSRPPNGVAEQIPARYGSAMTDWPSGWRPDTLEQAEEWLMAHDDGSGDSAIREACDIEVEKHIPNPLRPRTGQGGGLQPSPYSSLSGLSDDPFEEEGAD